MLNHKIDSDFQPDENSSGTARFDTWGFANTTVNTLNRHLTPEVIHVEPDMVTGTVYKFTGYMTGNDDYVAAAFITDDSGEVHLMNMDNFTVKTHG